MSRSRLLMQAVHYLAHRLVGSLDSHHQPQPPGGTSGPGDFAATRPLNGLSGFALSALPRLSRTTR